MKDSKILTVDRLMYKLSEYNPNAAVMVVINGQTKVRIRSMEPAGDPDKGYNKVNCTAMKICIESTPDEIDDEAFKDEGE